jgi:crotonobetainyl-CoA:carnitine CoA-transferase CaiB-like acyl-CoA transferase
MVPAATVLLADFGADVIKVEHTDGGDPARNLVTGGMRPTQGGVNVIIEQANRQKRSIALDLTRQEGRDILYEMAATTDVFITSYLPATRQKLGIDVDDIRAVNPQVIYARGDAVGPAGPDAGKPGFDMAVFFGRGGILNSFTPAGAPLVRPRPGFGDKTASLSLAFGIASALYRRQRTGEASVIDVSLLGTAMWVSSSDIVYSAALGSDFSRLERPASNPVATNYATGDGRWIMLAMPNSQRWWGPLCHALDHPEMATDPRFAEAAARTEHAAECSQILAEIFASAPLSHWRERLASFAGPWEPVADSYEVISDVQAVANGYIAEVQHPSGQTLRVVRSPVVFDARPPDIGVAPEFGQHTEEILVEQGHSWDEIVQLKTIGAIP